MTEMHSFVSLASNKPNKIIMNGNVTAFLSKGWWTRRPRNQTIWHWKKKGGSKLPNEKAFNSNPGFQKKDFFFNTWKRAFWHRWVHLLHMKTQIERAVFSYMETSLYKVLGSLSTRQQLHKDI